MSQYFPTQLYNQLNGARDYMRGTFEAASYNFTISTQFELIQKTNDVAIVVFEEPSLNLKAKHFFSHIAVGAILCVPILNFLVFLGFESEEEDDMPALENIPLDPPDTEEKVMPALQNIPLDPPDTEGNDSPEEPSKKFTIEASPHMKRLQRRNSRVSQKALALEQNKLNQQQETLDAVSPVLDGERSNPVSIAEFKEIESSFTKEFFRLFPNETCDSEFASLRKRQEAESLGVVLNDSKYIESFILYTEGSTPEARFKRPTENLAALNQFIQSQYPTLKDNFYILGNFKNDMQNKIDAIPYIHIIKILFRATPEEFQKELNNYKFLMIPAMEGEKTPIRIDTIEFQKTHKTPGKITKRLTAYRNSAANTK